jgi:sister chromatid cohesion protein PDS5
MSVDITFLWSSNSTCAQSIADSIPDAVPDLQAAHVAVLAQFARFAADAFESRSDVIVPFLLTDMLMAPIP